MHPLFTELANLLQNALFATEQMGCDLQSCELQNNRYRISQDFLYGSNLPMTNITIPFCPLFESTNNPEEQTP
jgi:hypothetical protein